MFSERFLDITSWFWIETKSGPPFREHARRSGWMGLLLYSTRRSTFWVDVVNRTFPYVKACFIYLPCKEIFLPFFSNIFIFILDYQVKGRPSWRFHYSVRVEIFIHWQLFSNISATRIYIEIFSQFPKLCYSNHFFKWNKIFRIKYLLFS